MALAERGSVRYEFRQFFERASLESLSRARPPGGFFKKLLPFCFYLRVRCRRDLMR